MGRNKKTLKLASLFKTKELLTPATKKHHHLYPWHFFPSCTQNKTLSFRTGGDDTSNTLNNSVFFDPFESKVEGCTTESDHDYYEGESMDMLVRGVRSERFFFEPENTSSILEQKAKIGGVTINQKSVLLLAIESEDPYGDFRRSMEDMVETHGLKDWKSLEELLSLFLRLNGKNNHGFIVLAFVDLLISLAAADSDSCSHDSTSYSSAVSSFASSSIYLLDQNEIQNEDTIRS